MRILLTGGGGMVGRAIARALAHGPNEVLAPPSIELDLTDAVATRSYLRSHNPDLVIHAAGRVGGIADNLGAPFAYLRDNTAMAVNVIGESVGAKIPQLLNLGSSCMYPRDWRQPLIEEDLLAGPLEPTNEGYALAKIMAERMCAYASEEMGFTYRTIVPSNLYGPHDHFELPRAHLVAAALRKVHDARLHKASSVEVWGDGTAKREFTYVDDLAGWIAAMVPRIESLPGRMNVGCGIDHTVRQYYELAAEVVGFDGDLDFDTSRPTGMTQKLMDSTRARSYGWTAQTELREGLAATYRWFLDAIASTGSR